MQSSFCPIGKAALRMQPDRKHRIRSRASHPTIGELLRIVLFLLTTSAVSPVFGETVVEVPLVRAASYPNQQGFVRVTSTGDGGDVEIHAWDDTGMYAPVTPVLSLAAGTTVAFNSMDLENGAPNKGLSMGIGTGTGDWRLQLRGNIDFKVGAYLRTDDGFLTAMGSTLLAYRPEVLGLGSEGCAFEANIFNPGSNRSQRSWLRLINYDLAPARVEIVGIDESGSRRGPVGLEIEPGASRALTSQQLEEGDSTMTGALGDGAGKWRLFVTSESPLSAMNLLETITGHLTNLGPSTMPGYGGDAVPLEEAGCESAPPFILSSDR